MYNLDAFDLLRCRWGLNDFHVLHDPLDGPNRAFPMGNSHPLRDTKEEAPYYCNETLNKLAPGQNEICKYSLSSSKDCGEEKLSSSKVKLVRPECLRGALPNNTTTHYDPPCIGVELSRSHTHEV